MSNSPSDPENHEACRPLGLHCALGVRKRTPLPCGGKAPTPPQRDSPREPRLGSGMSLADSRPARRVARQERARRPANPSTLPANRHNLHLCTLSAPRAALRLHLPDPKGREALGPRWQMEAQCRSRNATHGSSQANSPAMWGQGPHAPSAGLPGGAPARAKHGPRGFAAGAQIARQEQARRPANPSTLPANRHNLHLCNLSAPRAALRLHLPDPKGREAPLGASVANGGAVQVAERDPTPRGGLGGTGEGPPWG